MKPQAFKNMDVIVAPTGSTQLVVANLIGHPAVILPKGIRGDDAPKPQVRTTVSWNQAVRARP
jgi:hypothetical protein